MSVYNLGIVKSSHIHEEDYGPFDHMYCHEYNEDVAGNVINNVDSVIMKTLTSLCCSMTNSQRRAEQPFLQLFRAQE